MIDEARCGISRDAFLDAMTAPGIGVGVHYSRFPNIPITSTVRLAAGALSECDAHRPQTVSLPMSPNSPTRTSAT